ncbi:MAG: dihydroneopterin aldolase [Alphaproteobacteria bacterium]|nr:dihydroneopterin aldolase [Alphaproteobacteria bacterium]
MKFNRAPVTPLPVSPVREETTGHYLIRITDLVLPASIGVYDREKQAPQRVRINVELQVAEHGRPRDDDIANVLSYEDIVSGIRMIVGRGHINLVETLAEEIADLCLADLRVAQARIGVDKLDVEPDAAAVGIEIERSR